MITIMGVIERLQDKGLDARYQEVIKNGVKFKAVTIRDNNSNIAPTIYLDRVVENANATGKDMLTVVNEVLAIYEENRQADFNCNAVLNRDYILTHVNIGLQRASNEDIIKRATDLEGIEQYLYITVDVHGTSGSIKLQTRHIDIADVKESELWKAAKKNLHKSVKVQTFSEMMPFIGDAGDYMFVLSNTHNSYGAAAAIDKATIKNLADEYNFTEYVLIPSSRHEVILIPNGIVEMDIDAMTNMVIEVNQLTVEPVDQLADRAYKLAV